MAYRELVKEWHAGVLALEKADWASALRVFGRIENPSSKIEFNVGCAHLARGDLERALQAFERTVSKDPCLAVGFYQRGYVCLWLERHEEALNDFRLALTHLRKNSCIDYKQLGLKVVLCAWEVLYNTAAAHCRLGNWQVARQTLEEAIGRDPKGQNPHLDVAVEQVQEQVFLEPRCIPQGEFFRPRKKDVDELESKDFLGQPKVISSAFEEDQGSGFPRLQSQSAPALEDVPPTQRKDFHRDSSPVQLKVHGSYTADLTLSRTPSVAELRILLREECHRQAEQMMLGYRLPGSEEMILIHSNEELRTVWQGAEGGHLTLWSMSTAERTERPALYQMVACHSYSAQGPGDLNLKEGDKLEILSEVNEEWLEGCCDGTVGIFPKCFAARGSANPPPS